MSDKIQPEYRDGVPYCTKRCDRIVTYMDSPVTRCGKGCLVRIDMSDVCKPAIRRAVQAEREFASGVSPDFDCDECLQRITGSCENFDILNPDMRCFSHKSKEKL